jgi:hypothetical protein
VFHHFTINFTSLFSLRFTLVIFASKQTKRSEIQVYFFDLNFSLRFDLVIFASKRNKAKRNSSLFFRSESCEIRLFSLPSDEIFASISNFASEAIVRAHSTMQTANISKKRFGSIRRINKFARHMVGSRLYRGFLRVARIFFSLTQTILLLLDGN